MRVPRPSRVALVAADGSRTVTTVDVGQDVDTFSIPAAARPAAVLLDPDVRVLASLAELLGREP